MGKVPFKGVQRNEIRMWKCKDSILRRVLKGRQTHPVAQRVGRGGGGGPSSAKVTYDLNSIVANMISLFQWFTASMGSK
jgi:hypothetical protein